MESVIGTLAEYSIVALLLGLGIYFLYNQNNKKDSEIERLNQELRSSEKENLENMMKLINVIESLDQREQAAHQEVLKELNNLKTTLLLKINDLKE